MPSKYQSEEIWQSALAAQLNYLRVLQSPENRALAVQSITKTKSRIERIRANGLPEWRENEHAHRT